eukprot:scaffold127988_cov33-Phaeocystis_antarctica.AAC.1
MATRSISGRISGRPSVSRPPSAPGSTPLVAPPATLMPPAPTPLVLVGGRGARPGGSPRPGGPPPTPLDGRGAGDTAGVPTAAGADAGASAAACPLGGAAAASA